MAEIWELYKAGQWEVPFLTFSIYLFILGSFIMYLIIVASRSNKIKKERLRNEYSSLIEKVMSSVIFEDASFSTIKEDKNFLVLFDTSFFREVLTESLINLHKNYEGIYAKKLEQFYKDSGLIKDSFRRLKSLKWEVKCRAITELAEFNVNEGFDLIIAFSKARNKTLKITAINACIKLGGTKSIAYLVEHSDPIDDWMQLNIINAFKKHDIGDTEGIEFLLESQNTTVVTLGLKLIKELKLTQKVPHVAQLAAQASNTVIKYEAQSILQTLTI
ncbi:HEAT repeat domain-containing protein [Flavobacterium ginsenosidimutans]|uniref:HEAT repeat domain-containing protein n=1 Tax=Flavobacterium ginsenosidimutans TaxID=687844 RepID=UPI003D9529CE